MDPDDPAVCGKRVFSLHETLLLPLAPSLAAWPPPGRPGRPLATDGPPKWDTPRKGGGYPKNDEKIKVLRMEFSIVEILSGLQESIFSLFRRPQLHSREKIKKKYKFILNSNIFSI